MTRNALLRRIANVSWQYDRAVALGQGALATTLHNELTNLYTELENTR